MKYLPIELKRLERVAKLIKSGNPPEGMSKEHWIGEIVKELKGALEDIDTTRPLYLLPSKENKDEV